MGALALMLTASAVSAGGEIASNQRLPVSPDRYDGAFIDRETAITGCMELVEEIRTSGGEVPDFFARQREYFRDLKRQLQKEKFPNGQELMMGAAIKVCMREKGWVNTCVSSTGRDGDLQTLETARAPSCWANKQHAEPKQAPPEPQIAERQPPVTQPSPAIIERQQLPVIIERQPPVIAEAERQPPVIIPPN